MNIAYEEPLCQKGSCHYRTFLA